MARCRCCQIVIFCQQSQGLQSVFLWLIFQTKRGALCRDTLCLPVLSFVAYGMLHDGNCVHLIVSSKCTSVPARPNPLILAPLAGPSVGPCQGRGTADLYPTKKQRVTCCMLCRSISCWALSRYAQWIVERCSDPQQDANAAHAQLDEVLQVSILVVLALSIPSHLFVGRPTMRNALVEHEQRSRELQSCSVLLGWYFCMRLPHRVINKRRYSLRLSL